MFDTDELIEQKFGKLKVISKNEELSRKRKCIVYNCECDCGNKNVIASRSELLSGKRTDCKKCQAYQYAGMVIGDFTVVDKNVEIGKIKKQTFWNCKCNRCGYVRLYTITELNKAIKNNNTLKCSKCEHLARRNKVIQNMLDTKQFGDLEVISYDEEASLKNDRDTYICKCSCGNIVSILGFNLRSGVAKSCGCKSFKFKNKIANIKNDFNEEKDIVTKVNSINDISKFAKSELYELSQSIDSEGYKNKYYYNIFKGFRYTFIRSRDASKEWLDSFDTFYNDIIDTYKIVESMYPGIQLYMVKIIDTEPHSKDNFKFTPTCPNSNRSINNLTIEYKDQLWSASMLAKEYGEANGIYVGALQARLNLGWTVDEALYTPKGNNRGQYDKPISPIYFIEDVEREHKHSQGLNDNDIDYTYKPVSMNIEDVNKQQIIKYNKTQSKGLFSTLKELGKEDK